MASRHPPVNPYAGKRSTAPQTEAMGRQSQQRNSQQKRKHQLAAANNPNKRKAKRGEQPDLEGNAAFDPIQDCIICKAVAAGRKPPHRGHDKRCLKNRATKGRGDLHEQTLASEKEAKRLQKLMNTDLTEAEKGSWRYSTKEAGEKFFAAHTSSSSKKPTKKIAMVEELSPQYLCKAVTTRLEDTIFCEKHKTKSAPLAMLAFAGEVAKNIIGGKKKNDYLIQRHFDGLTMTVPYFRGEMSPQYHSIVGQKLLYVDWERMGIQVPCPDASCSGELQNQRSQFSKNQTLFPIFTIDGLPSWCITMNMKCSCCKRTFDSNSADVLVAIPTHASNLYPVETKYASTGTYHLSRSTTQVFSSIMLTYGNGELCSRLLYDAINREYVQKASSYYSLCQHIKQISPDVTLQPYVQKDGTFIRQFPPLGDTIRDLFDQAASSSKNPWGISDNERHTREIQSVKCDGIFSQDHTFQATKNYQKSLGAEAVWDVATSTGEIATAVLVPTTKTKHFSHAAKQLTEREGFNPKAMYSDTWPNKQDFWHRLFPGLEGRLGLFHFEKRIISTLRKNHIDHGKAVSGLLSCLYSYVPEDYEKVLKALRNGSLSATGRKYSNNDIAHMKSTGVFRRRYGKYLRKQMKSPETIRERLDDWFVRYKVTASTGSRPAEGRLDPYKGYTLFTAETKTAVENCKEKAVHLVDPVPLEEMYDAILPSPNSNHGLTEYLSRRGESKLEAFHDRLANFANGGMRRSLCDNLSLCGTARYNLGIRHKRALIKAQPEERKNIPSGWDRVVAFWNHTELWFINDMATAVGLPLPFPNAEKLKEDNGERFFSEYMATVKPNKQLYAADFCLCDVCVKVPFRQPQQQETPSADSNSNTSDNSNGQTDTTMVDATVDNVSDRRPRQQQEAPAPPPPVAAAPVAQGVPLAPWPTPAAINQFYWIQMAPLTPPPGGCCEPFKAWLRRTGRKGAPPHLLCCPYKDIVNGYTYINNS
ncbi:unknown protein [Seminavis robusta]|uniref:Uncharacterized protein n=1 Tax=Seminavis robusta TaxID=568900 RepID=A0A9N8DJN4_9STRA|nr:unknown protein [Seminavis robusta]|eukprot:Sro180_g078681.1  (984) ;mRNA; f:22748-25699